MNKLLNQVLDGTYAYRRIQFKSLKSPNSGDGQMIHSLFPVQRSALDGSNFSLSNVARSVLLVILRSHGLTQMAAWDLILSESSAQSMYNTQKIQEAIQHLYAHIQA